MFLFCFCFFLFVLICFVLCFCFAVCTDLLHVCLMRKTDCLCLFMKITSGVKIPLRNWNIAEFMGKTARTRCGSGGGSGSGSSDDMLYDLQGLVSHSGTLHGVCYCVNIYFVLFYLFCIFKCNCWFMYTLCFSTKGHYIAYTVDLSSDSFGPKQWIR